MKISQSDEEFGIDVVTISMTAEEFLALRDEVITAPLKTISHDMWGVFLSAEVKPWEPAE